MHYTSTLHSIVGFYLTSWRTSWCTLNKRILIFYFVWDTNMTAVSIVFCVSWDCVKTKNIRTSSYNILHMMYCNIWKTSCAPTVSKFKQLSINIRLFFKKKIHKLNDCPFDMIFSFYFKMGLEVNLVCCVEGARKLENFWFLFLSSKFQTLTSNTKLMWLFYIALTFTAQ